MAVRATGKGTGEAMDGPISGITGLAPAAHHEPTRPASAPDGAAWRSALAGAEAGGSDRQAAGMAALSRFEAVVLQNFIEAMLPDDASSVYGEGLSGEMWKSMMSEKIAEEFASQGGLGIAERIAARFSRPGT